MNMLTNISMQELDEAGLLSPVGESKVQGRQAEIADGVRRARRLRAEAYHAAVRRLWWGVRRLLAAGSR
jgi:hypothetical protein